MNELPLCPICKRELGDPISGHHLLPKSLGGKKKYPCHVICHSKIHRIFTERELHKYYNTFERIMEHPEMQKFAKWVSKRPISYRDKSIESKERKRKRRR